jgi:nucleotide-binding universal stress UspA family protein
MGPIVCATRGGEASLRAQEKAIELAKERGSELIFLYVVDPSFAGDIEEAMVDTLTDELRRLGKCLLRLARTRARERGQAAQIAIRRGAIQQSVIAYLQEADASTLVVGSPQPDAGPQTFDRERLSGFAAAVQAATGVEVVVVE